MTLAPFARREIRRSPLLPVRRARPYRFEVRKKPRCGTCEVTMRLARRSPHPALGEEYELQEFRCRLCNSVQEVDAAAKYPAA